MPTTATPPALDSAPLAVRAFVAAHDLAEHLAVSVRLAETIFPVGSSMTLRVEEDPEVEGKWVLMDWSVPATVGGALGAYRRFVTEWNAIAPPQAGALLRVTFHVA